MKEPYQIKKSLTIPFIFFMTGVFIMSCGRQQKIDPLPKGAEAISLLGDTLSTPEIDPANFDSLNNGLIRAVMDYRIDPEEMESIIWLGRRTAYIGEYREALRIFTEGVYKAPEDPRMYRHRGHRYITLRKFDLALEDFKSAEDLMRSLPDQVEPDGLPNEAGIPTSTLKSNVFYHQGLAHYLKGDFTSAAGSYRKAEALELTDDMKIALMYWHYMALKRDGNDMEAGELLKDVNSEIELLENDAYLNLLLVFKGVFEPDHLLESGADALQNATLAYGIGNWHYMNGRTERAYQIWQNLYDPESSQWPAFGFIAAEAELARRSFGS
jgi:tetratricopeptide (TPR) repeat protein